MRARGIRLFGRRIKLRYRIETIQDIADDILPSGFVVSRHNTMRDAVWALRKARAVSPLGPGTIILDQEHPGRMINSWDGDVYGVTFYLPKSLKHLANDYLKEGWVGSAQDYEVIFPEGPNV